MQRLRPVAIPARREVCEVGSKRLMTWTTRPYRAAFSSSILRNAPQEASCTDFASFVRAKALTARFPGRLLDFRGSAWLSAGAANPGAYRAPDCTVWRP